MSNKLFDSLQKKKLDREIEEGSDVVASPEDSKASKIITGKIIPAVSICFCIFQLYTAATMPLSPMNQRTIHCAFALSLVFLYSAAKEKHLFMRLIDYLFVAVNIGANMYILLNWVDIPLRSARLTSMDRFFAVCIIVIVIEAARRNIGIWMPIISIVFIAYAYFGQRLTGLFSVPMLSLNRFLNYVSLGTEGIYGTCVGTSATFAFTFILFAEFLMQLGAGDFIIDLAEALLGNVRGGPAKIAIMASGLFGTISGSAVANVAGTGCMTIPLMKKKGFRPEFAAGVEAAASTGGQIMPPVMGTSAFLMSEMISVAYSVICAIAIIPAILYFLCVFIVVDLEAAKNGLVGVSRSELPNIKSVLKNGWHYLFCIGTLIFLLVGLQWSPSKSALWAIIVLVISDILKKIISHQKLEFGKIVPIMTKACKSILTVATATTCAGVVVGSFTATGLNLRLSSMLVDLSGGHLPLLLILAMIGAIILGMGLPPTSVYILMAVLVAPALTTMGLSKIVAHMFLFYFGVMATITPPVGLAFYVGAGIAGCPPIKAGIEAVKLAIVGFVVPYIFVYNPALLLQGTPAEIIQVALTTFIGVLAFAFCFIGYCKNRLSVPVRILFLIGGILAVIPTTLTDIIGVIIVAVVLGTHVIRARRKHTDKSLETSNQTAV